MVDTNVSEQAFPNETANYTSYQNGPQPSKTIQIAVFTLIMVLSLIGNFLIVAVFYTDRTLRTPINTFIVNMAISDLIIPVITLPWKITTVYHDGLWLVGGVVGTVLCKLTRSSWSVSTFVSIFSMIAIAVDRFHAVLFPIRLPLISLINCYIIIATTWVVSVASHAHYLYAAKLVTNDAGLVCEFQWEPASYTKEMEEITQLLLFCLTAISAIVLTVLYSSIIVYLYRQKNKLHLETDIVRERAKRNRKITLMLVIVVVFFYAVWIPYNVASFTLFVTPGITTLPDIFFWIAGWFLPVLYPVANPVVYYIFNDKYRQGFRKLLCCGWRCKDKCGNHPLPVKPHGGNNVHDTRQVNDIAENVELQQR